MSLQAQAVPIVSLPVSAPDVQAGYTTRRFPILLKKTDDLLDAAVQKRFRSHFPLPIERFAFLRQVHGDRIAVAQGDRFSEPRFHHFPECDAILTDVPDLALLVMTADCLSIFLCGARAGRVAWIGLVHAGWRGTQKRITAKTVRLICDRSGLAPSDISAAFGPCIGADRYEVGEEFQVHFPDSPFLSKKNGRRFFDLAGENRQQLLDAGLSGSNIFSNAPCTLAETDRFYSFRREKESAGRMVSFIFKK